MSNTDLPYRSLWRILEAERGSIPLLLRERARISPARVYLRWQGESWTFAETLAQAERFAGYLRAIDFAGVESRCGTYLANCPEALWTWFGTQLAGSTYVPLNRAHRGVMLGDQIQRARVLLLVTDVAALDDLPDLSVLGVRHLLIVDREGEDAHGVETVPYRTSLETDRWSGVAPSPSALGTIMFSSGSTGRSKAVKLPHNQLFRGAIHVAEAMQLGPADVVHEWLPHFHMMGALYALLAPLAAGSTVELRPRLSTSRFWEEVREARATVIAGLSNLMETISDLADEETLASNTVRLALIAGTNEKTKRDFAKRFSVHVLDFYGMTEAEPVTVSRLDGDEPRGSHGRPTADFEIAVVDSDGLPVATNATGEIVCRPRIADVLFQGYEEDDESTVTAWRDLWFHTGDRGYLDAAGSLFFLGRGTFSIRRSGENVSAFELEQIAGKHPGIASVVAIGVSRGKDDDDIKLVVMPEEGATVEPPELHRWCQTQMASFMVPRYIEVRDSLPTFGIGKIDRQALSHLDHCVWDAESEGVGSSSENRPAR